MSRIHISEQEIEDLATVCLTITKAMCKSLRSHGLPVTAEVVKVISQSLATSLIAGKLASLQPIDKLH